MNYDEHVDRCERRWLCVCAPHELSRPHLSAPFLCQFMPVHLRAWQIASILDLRGLLGRFVDDCDARRRPRNGDTGMLPLSSL
jgi:hypothetical protein